MGSFLHSRAEQLSPRVGKRGGGVYRPAQIQIQGHEKTHTYTYEGTPAGV